MSAMIMNGKTPTLISGVPNVTPSRATIRSHARASPSAPARTCPFAAQIVGLPSSPTSVNSRGNFVVPKCLWTSGTSAAKPARLPPELKTFSCVDVRTIVVVAGALERRDERVEHRVAQRVARVGVVEADRGDARLDVVADRLSGHGGGSLRPRGAARPLAGP
jgi:hypothetical protein